MKVTKTYLNQIVREEADKLLKESEVPKKIKVDFVGPAWARSDTFSGADDYIAYVVNEIIEYLSNLEADQKPVAGRITFSDEQAGTIPGSDDSVAATARLR